MPFATYAVRSLSRTCTCMSIRPGSRYFPDASIRDAPAGIGTDPFGAIEEIRSPSTITV